MPKYSKSETFYYNWKNETSTRNWQSWSKPYPLITTKLWTWIPSPRLSKSMQNFKAPLKVKEPIRAPEWWVRKIILTAAQICSWTTYPESIEFQSTKQSRVHGNVNSSILIPSWCISKTNWNACKISFVLQNQQ